MKIVRNDVKVTKFGDVVVGSVFIQDDNIFMKTLKFYEIEKDSFGEETHYDYNAINLGNGEFACFVYNEIVKVCNDAYLVAN